MISRKTALLRAREREAPWTDLREQRVLRRILLSRSEANSSPKPRFAPRLYAALALAAAAGVAFGVWLYAARAMHPEPIAQAVSASAPMRKLELSDGSLVELAAGADAEVVRREPHGLRVLQRRGQVHYRVAHDPARQFVIQAADVEVRVRGTEFSVELSNDAVAVHVTSGRVEVDDGTRVTTLLTGEALRVRAYSARAAAASAAEPEAPAPASADSAAPAEPKPEHVEATPRVDSVDALFQEVTDARASGRSAVAATRLREIVRRFPRDPRVPSAYFTLGRVERARGAHAAAARAFLGCANAAPGGTLAAEALAEAAASWLSAGQKASAARVAERYLKAFPKGSHAARMQAIVE